jgi:3-methyladenine DNA glycosylase AlkD
LDKALKIVNHLKEIGDEQIIEKNIYFGITNEKSLGIKIPEIRKIAKNLKKDNSLAEELWESGYYEARVLATLIAEKEKFTPKQMDAWTNCFLSWAICDAACYNLYRYTPYYEEKIFEYVKSDKEFVRRTPFALIAGLAIGRKDIKDEDFLKYFPLIEEYVFDERTYVWKAISWALRQMGKRSLFLHLKCLSLSEKLSKNPNYSKAGKDAFRELSSEKIIQRIK